MGREIEREIARDIHVEMEMERYRWRDRGGEMKIERVRKKGTDKDIGIGR